MRYGSIYVLTNRVNNCQYVGQTIKSVKTRWRSHVASSKKPQFDIGKAIDQYSEYAFDVEEVFVAFDKDGLDAAEISWIAELDPVYNMTRGGAGAPTKETSPELRAKRSEAAKKRWADPEWKAKTIAQYPADARIASGKRLAKHNGGAVRWAGHEKPEKTPYDRSATTKKTWLDAEIRAKRLAGLKAVTATEEFKTKMSAVVKGRTCSAEHIKKCAEAKHKALYCIELDLIFGSMKKAAEYFGVKRSTVSMAVKNERKLLKQYTLIKA